MFKHSLLLILGFLFSLSVNASVPKLYQVLPLDGSEPKLTLYRGGQPDEEGVAFIATLGTKTILNLTESQSKFELEKKWAEANGMKDVRLGFVPLFSRPSKKRVAELIQFIMDDSNYPLFIHCKHGEDRTGMAIGLYRVLREKVDPEVAYQEMIKYNFHPRAHAGLRCAFLEAVGQPVPKFCDWMPVQDGD
jgi:protein tyrosine/serine phosphatase